MEEEGVEEIAEGREEMVDSKEAERKKAGEKR